MQAMETVTYEATPVDVIGAYRLFYISSLRSGRTLRGLLIPAVVCAAVYGFLVWYLCGCISEVPLACLAGFAFWSGGVGIVLLGNYLHVPRRARRIYAQQKALHDVMVITWDDNEITLTSTRGVGSYNWSDFLKARRNEQALLLFQSDAAFNFIPMRVLTTEQADGIMASFARAKSTGSAESGKA